MKKKHGYLIHVQLSNRKPLKGLDFRDDSMESFLMTLRPFVHFYFLSFLNLCLSDCLFVCLSDHNS